MGRKSGTDNLQAGRSLQQHAGMADFAIVQGSDATHTIMVFTMQERKTVANMKSNKKFQLAFGPVEWTRTLNEILCKALGFTTHEGSLQLDGAAVFPYPFQTSALFWVKSKRMGTKEMLEYANELITAPKTIEEFPRFAEKFEEHFGEDEEYTCPKALKQACCDRFGKWAPEVRTTSTGPYADKPVTHMAQVPPAIREKLSPRMQCKGPHLCPECGKPRNEASRYCSQKHEQVNNKLVCPCGSTNVQWKRHKFTFETNEN